LAPPSTQSAAGADLSDARAGEKPDEELAKVGAARPVVASRKRSPRREMGEGGGGARRGREAERPPRQLPCEPLERVEWLGQ